MTDFDHYLCARTVGGEEVRERHAVKRGFSWPAFLFGPMWAFAWRMWALAAVLAVILVPLNVATTAAFAAIEGSGGIVIGVLALVATIGVAVLVGTRANDWRRRWLEARDFEKVGVIHGESAKRALAAHGDERAVGAGYSMATLVTGAIFAAAALFQAIGSLVWGLGAGSTSGLGPTMGGALMYALIGAFLLLRAHYPPVGFLRAASTVVGALLLGMFLDATLALFIGPGVQDPRVDPAELRSVLVGMSIFFLLTGAAFVVVGFWGVWRPARRR